MKYNYDAELECFVREDGNGKKFYINSYEAQRIVTLRELGASVGKICARINFASGKVSESSVKNFLKNVDEGNIIVYGDYPAPKKTMDDLSVSGLEDRIIRLEKRVDEINDRLNELKDDCWITSFAGERPVKKNWKERLDTWLGY